MSNWSSLRNQIDPLLNDLQPVAQRIALTVCFTYSLPLDKDVNAEIGEERKRAARGSRALRQLDRGLKSLRARVESTLGAEMIALNDEIRTAHIPYDIPALLPLPNDSGLATYFQQRNLPDPANLLRQFLALWPDVEELARRESHRLRSVIPTMHGTWKKVPRRYWRRGGAEYILTRLFKEYALRRFLMKDIEERVARLLQAIDGGNRSIDVTKGGCAAVREAIKRVRIDSRHKESCDAYLAQEVARLSR